MQINLSLWNLVEINLNVVWKEIIGFELCYNLCNKNDIIKNKFYDLNYVLRKFPNVRIDVFQYLFKTFFYGSCF